MFMEKSTLDLVSKEIIHFLCFVQSSTEVFKRMEKNRSKNAIFFLTHQIYFRNQEN